MAGVTCHSVNGIEDRSGGNGGVFGAQSLYELIRWKRSQMSSWCRGDQGFGERQAATIGRRLQDDVDIL